MRGWWLLPLLLACKDKQDRREPVIVVEPTVITYVTPACEQAIDKAAAAPLAARPKILIDSCHVCNNHHWKPLLAWNVEPASGGPRREDIEKLMVACDAFCTGDSKLKFMAGIDKARGQSVDVPWRRLADTCKDKVDASSDHRFMSAPYFALDRIARALATVREGALSDKLAPLELPLPALTVSGAGVALPEAETVAPSTGVLAITVIGDAIHVGRMPRAHLGAAGVKVDLPAPGYPGEQVNADQLAAKLTELVADDASPTITLLAPHAMPAQKLVPIIAAAAPIAPVYLAANATDSPEGWQLAGAIPIALEAGKDIQVTDEMTVQNLARDLAARAARKEQRVGVTKR